MTERAASSPRGAGSLADALARVPAELKAEPRWVCWRREERNGRATKLPVDAHTGRMAKSTDPATWAAFEEAVAAVGRWRCDGVGFVFGPDRAFTGLDLDHVISDGALDPAYRWVVEEAGTYTEVSPSGDGLHLIFRGAKPDWAQRSRKGQPGGRVVEMYDHDRYFTVTGDVFEGRGALAENPGVVERAYRTWIEPETRSSQPRLEDAVREASPGDMGDDELVERMLASRSGGDIRALLAGDCSAQGGDHSAADMALCSHLAFWCAGDAARMDRIFRASGLMRDKWDSRRGGTTYGAQTIERAISGATEFYKPRAARRDGSSRPRANNKNTCSMSTRREQQGVPDDDAAPREATEGAPSVEGWYVDERGRLWAADAAGGLRYTVTATAPWIACDLVDVDTGDVRALGARCLAVVGTREATTYGIDMCNIHPGSSVVVIGGGMIGLIMMQLARISGATKVALLEPVAGKRAVAEQLGADLTVDSINDDPAARLAEAGFGNIDVVIECVGKPVTIEQAIGLAGHKATVMMFGLTKPDETITVKPFEIFQKELVLTSSYINPYTQRRALALIDSGRLDVSSMVHAVASLEELPDILGKPEIRALGKYIISPEK